MYHKKNKYMHVNKGKKHTEEAREKIGNARRGKRLPPHTEETKRKMSDRKKANPTRYWLGKKRDVKTREKISNSLKELNLPSPSPKYWKGRKHNEQSKKKIKENNARHWLGKSGDKHAAWKGGLAIKKYPLFWTETLRRSVRERDGYICKLCGKTQVEEIEERERRLAVHHIDYNKENCNPNNLITLCVRCNSVVNWERKYWEKEFKKLVNNK